MFVFFIYRICKSLLSAVHRLVPVSWFIVRFMASCYDGGVLGVFGVHGMERFLERTSFERCGYVTFRSLPKGSI